jgi:hypothetical protein
MRQYPRSFIIAILAAASLGSQNFLFASSAASLTSKLRSLSIRAIFRQDSEFAREPHTVDCPNEFFSVEYFDKEENNVRKLESMRIVKNS